MIVWRSGTARWQLDVESDHDVCWKERQGVAPERTGLVEFAVAGEENCWCMPVMIVSVRSGRRVQVGYQMSGHVGPRDETSGRATGRMVGIDELAE
jgi:hypothetical protein